MKRFLTEGFMLAALSILGYTLAFIYEYNYCNYFGIPTWLIQVDFSNIIFAIGSLISLGAFVWFTVLFLKNMRIFKHEAFQLKAAALLPIFSLLLVPFSKSISVPTRLR